MRLMDPLACLPFAVLLAHFNAIGPMSGHSLMGWLQLIGYYYLPGIAHVCGRDALEFSSDGQQGSPHGRLRSLWSLRDRLRLVQRGSLSAL